MEPICTKHQEVEELGQLLRTAVQLSNDENYPGTAEDPATIEEREALSKSISEALLRIPDSEVDETRQEDAS